MHDQEIVLPASLENARIGLLGGSFDPPHLGHQLLALSILALEPIEELWIIPCNSHAFKNDLTAFHHRFSMCKKAFSRIKSVYILAIENKLKAPNFTINTLNAISQKRPDLRFLLCLGSDLLPDFHKWKDPEKIIELAKFAIFERRDFPIGILPPLLKNAHVHRGYSLPAMASSHLRKMLANDDIDTIISLLDREVLKYIKDNNLYKK